MSALGDGALYYLAGSWGVALIGALPVHRQMVKSALGRVDRSDSSEDEKQLEAVVEIDETWRKVVWVVVFAPLLLMVIAVVIPCVGLWCLGKIALKGLKRVAYPQDATSRKYLGGYAKYSGEEATV